MSLSDQLGGIPALTAVLVVITGVLGAVIVTPLMNAMRVRDYAARGFAAGLAAHGIGTARAFVVDPVAGTFAGIAMGLSAILVFAAHPGDRPAAFSDGVSLSVSRFPGSAKVPGRRLGCARTPPSVDRRGPVVALRAVEPRAARRRLTKVTLKRRPVAASICAAISLLV